MGGADPARPAQALKSVFTAPPHGGALFTLLSRIVRGPSPDPGLTLASRRRHREPIPMSLTPTTDLALRKGKALHALAREADQGLGGTGCPVSVRPCHALPACSSVLTTAEEAA
jgi:hypothetical protein